MIKYQSYFMLNAKKKSHWSLYKVALIERWTKMTDFINIFLIPCDRNYDIVSDPDKMQLSNDWNAMKEKLKT